MQAGCSLISQRFLVHLREDTIAQVVHIWGIICCLQVQHASRTRQEDSGLGVPGRVVGFVVTCGSMGRPPHYTVWTSRLLGSVCISRFDSIYQPSQRRRF